MSAVSAIPARTPAVVAPAPILAVIALMYTGILLVQTARTMYLDANSLSDSQFDLVGYALLAALGVPLLYSAVQQRRLRVLPVIGVSIFLLLLVMNIRVYRPEQLFSVIASRYGVMIWFLFGIGTCISLNAMRALLLHGRVHWFAPFATAALYVFLLPVAYIVYNYLSGVVETESYQQISSNAIILVCTALLVIASVDIGQLGTKVAAYLLLLLGTFLVYAIVLMQSTSIVAFWLAVFPLAALRFAGGQGKFTKIVMFAAVIIAIYWLSVALLMGDALKDTRFSMISNDIFELSSLQTRLSLLSGFGDQFAVAPLFGAFDAELQAGYFQGNYVHSIPLSLLTHTGIVGFVLMLTIIIGIVRSGFARGEFSTGLGHFALPLFAAILLLGSLFAFFTWMPFWYLLGIMCVRFDNEWRTGTAA